METIYLANATLKVREEEFGYSIFDGNSSIHVNEVFIQILRMLFAKMTYEDIYEKLYSEFEISSVPPEKIKEDIKYVQDLAMRKKWF